MPDEVMRLLELVTFELVKSEKKNSKSQYQKENLILELN